MALDWTQITLVATAAATAFGSSIGIPIANAFRRPGIDKAIEKGVEVRAQPLVAKDDDQQREIAATRAELAAVKVELAHALTSIQFLQQAILNWKPRREEPLAVALSTPREREPEVTP